MLPDGEALLRVEAVSKAYKQVKALDRVSFAAKAGEFIAILGPNGAGKSTLVQLLTGLFVPDEGTVFVGGYDLSSEPQAALATIGIVFQQQTLDAELSVTANLKFHADLFGLAGADAHSRIATLLERFGLADAARKPVRVLSGGMRRRLELARALLHRPSILIMDEATVGLDPASRRDILGHIRELRREENLLVLWTTHLIDEVESADRLILLDGGQLIFDGGSGALLSRTATQTIADAFFALTGKVRIEETARL